MAQTPARKKQTNIGKTGGQGRLVEGRIHHEDLKALLGFSDFKVKQVCTLLGWEQPKKGWWIVSTVAPGMKKALNSLLRPQATVTADQKDYHLARKRKVEADKAEGLLIDRGTAEAAVSRALSALKSRLRSVPSAVGATEPTTTPEVLAAIRRTIDEALTDTYHILTKGDDNDGGGGGDA